ncbi:MAG: glycosyltransferase family 2 protein [Bacteroidetes bacterium]|jgi:glycosyltransferase involved in cell wall biosynthesis|nr:glycosyltransferase family 2 protein [Bacteroidota bacterium]
MDISVVIPLFNEDESLPELTAEIKAVMEANGYDYEIIMVDDGSTDRSWAVLNELRAVNPRIKGIRFQRNYGKSAALQVGFQKAQGDVVFTMDADLQDRPQHIPEFYKMIKEEGYDLVSGWKQKRKDPITKTIPTKLYNAVNRIVNGVSLHDMNCGFKAYRRQVVKSIEVYGEMHRYIPVIAKAAGFRKIGELKVEHIARKYGVTKFGINRFLNGFLDLLTITFITKYMKRPMHFFGFWGVIFGMIGGFLLFGMYFLKLLGMTGLTSEYFISTHIPALFFAMITFLFGGLLLFTGLMAELIGRNSPFRNEYLVAEHLGLD